MRSNKSDLSSITFTSEQQAFWKDTLNEITYYNGKLPVAALQKLLLHPQKASDLMLYTLTWAVDAYPDISDRCIAHIYSLYALSQFRDTRAFPLLIELLAVLDDTEENPLLDVIAQDGAALLASVYDGNIKSIHEFIEDSDVSPLCRIAAIRSLCILYQQKQIQRQVLVDILSALENEGTTFGLENSSLKELYDQLKNFEIEPYPLIDDFIQNLSSWPWFEMPLR